MQLVNEFWAFIPARAGSKELKNKNITKLAGYPLLAYSVKTALKIKKIKKVILSSDSKKYISIAKKFGCKEFHFRSKKTSRDNSSELSFFEEFVYKQIKKKDLPKYFVHFRPTTPVRKINTVLKAIRYFLKNKNNYTA